MYQNNDKYFSKTIEKVLRIFELFDSKQLVTEFGVLLAISVPRLKKKYHTNGSDLT